jgi:Replication-relaxation
MLQRMKADGLVTSFKLRDKSIPDLWAIAKDVPPSKHNWDHEIDRGDLYVAFKKTGKVLIWNSKWDIDEWKDFALKAGVKYDCRAELEGVRQTIFFEVDRGGMTATTLKKKLDKYVRLSEMVSDPFVVVLTLQARFGTLKNRAMLLLDMISKFNRGRQFLVTPHQLIVKDPLGDVLVPASNPDTSFSILGL